MIMDKWMIMDNKLLNVKRKKNEMKFEENCKRKIKQEKNKIKNLDKI